MNQLENNVVRSFSMVKNDISALQTAVAHLESKVDKLQKEITARKIEGIKLQQKIKDVKTSKK